MKKVLLILTLVTSSLFSASFDCKKAKTDIEKLICSDKELSQLDDELNEAYKKALARSNNKEALKKSQIEWLNRIDKDCKKDYYPYCIKIEYIRKIFYLQPDGFNIIYSEDNKTCNWFANLLNNDLKQYNEINLSRHKEFNWIEWKQIQKEEEYKRRYAGYNVFISYFDINNDGNEEGVFQWEIQYKGYVMPDIKYTTKEDAKSIEEYIPYKTENNIWISKESELLRLQLPDQKNVINNGYYGYIFAKYIGEFFHNNTATVLSNNQGAYVYIRRSGGNGFAYPEPRPLKFDNKYYIAIFGVIERFDNRYRQYSMFNSGNIVTLAKYNPNNTKDDICILTRANLNSEKYLKYEEE
ncbi:MAG: lysozyme inhibitor LprI family protein [Campylobacteraceae bacterium]|jgi:hypothetical protein|nr:lysozyme inhibitor LprI family protein [Campylobacteraceae bacterium]